ncbi:MAG: hypothetical protein DI551_12560, partial [Micavibrio aeruginosavorus]
DVFFKRKEEMDFLTVGFSPATLLRSHRRTFPRPYNKWVRVNEHMRKYVWFPIYHPFNLKKPILNKLTMGLFRAYDRLLPRSLIKALGKVDLFIIENGAGLVLIPRLKKLFPSAKIIYTVCDRIETLDYHPVIIEAEKKALPFIDLVRVPSAVMVDDFKKPAKFHPNVRFIAHGLVKAQFDADMPNPYSSGKNVISIGDMLFDAEAIRTMANAYPDWTFHLFGKNAKLEPDMPNVIAYGERPFDALVPYIKHADIGLAPYRPAPDADYLSQSSMKMIQYTYCRLPILAPEFAATGRDHVVAYDPLNKDSIVSAMSRAIIYPRDTIDRSSVLDWDKAVDLMLEGIQ